MLANKKRHLEINCTPLKTSFSIENVGSVAGKQTYNALTKEYVPDYTLAPLTLFPRCMATDPDQYTPGGLVNAQLTNMTWTETIGNKVTPVSTGADYVITVEGEEKGKLVVNKNSNVLNPISLEFKAEYVDQRTGEVFRFRDTFTILVSDETGLPELCIDSPETLEWNPIREPKEQIITAKLIVGTKDLTALASTTFRWFRMLENGNIDPVGTDGDNDWEVISVNKNVLKIDRDFIGDKQTYICRAHYNPDGTAGEPVENDPSRVTTIIRKIPYLECDWKGVTYGVPNGQSTIRPIGFVRDNKGVIDNPDEWLKFVWLVKKPGEGSFSKVAEGREAEIPMTNGMQLDLQVEDKGAQAIIVDDTNPNIYIEDGGSVLTQRINE